MRIAVVPVVTAVLLLAASSLAADPLLMLNLDYPREARPNEIWPVRVVTSNGSTDAAIGVLLTVSLPPGAQVTNTTAPLGWRCQQEVGTYVCDTNALGQGTTVHEINVKLSGDPAGGNYELPVTLSASNAPPAQTPFVLFLVVPRAITVSSTADDGAGTLREALLQANTSCGPTKACDIVFDLPAGSTFEPLTPLPRITACGSLFINGGTTEFLADRPYELSGARVATNGKSFGLDYRPVCEAPPHLHVTGLAINRFADDGITLSPFNTQFYENRAYSNVLLEGVFVGTDRTGREARPNGWRGITLHSASTILSVNYSILSGNGRSGLYVSNSLGTNVYACHVGSDAQGQPLGNGAAGIFLQRGQLYVATSEIAFNNDFGIALARSTAKASLQNGNAIHHNEFVGVDWGLDGPTRDSGEDAGIPNAPKITSATYDATTNTTIVRGTLEIGKILGERYDIRIFVNHQPNARGEYEGEVPIVSSGTNIFPHATLVYEWELIHRGDVTGTILTASTGVAAYSDLPAQVTSEFSNSISLR
jgi:hypothetical protein